MDSFASQSLSPLLVLVFVGVLAWAGIALLKRFQQGRAVRNGRAAESELTFVRAMPLGPKERVVVLRYRGEEWVLGVTAGGIALLSRHLPPSPTGSGALPKGRP